jgi:hypothetical protein
MLGVSRTSAVNSLWNVTDRQISRYVANFCQSLTRSGALCGKNTATISAERPLGKVCRVNDEVSVAELLVREGWGERPPPGSSRWRVVAVMLAVVIGCGTAAVLVAFGSGQVRQDAAPVDQIQVVPMPQRTTGLGGADQATDSPSDGGVGGGTGGDVVPGSDERRGTVTEVPGRAPEPQSSTEQTSATSSSSTTTGTVPTTTGSPTPSAPGRPPPPPSSTPHQVTCILIICW